MKKEDQVKSRNLPKNDQVKTSHK